MRNHAVCDGFHLCRLVNEVQELVNDLGAQTHSINN